MATLQIIGVFEVSGGVLREFQKTEVSKDDTYVPLVSSQVLVQNVLVRKKDVL